MSEDKIKDWMEKHPHILSGALLTNAGLNTPFLLNEMKSKNALPRIAAKALLPILWGAPVGLEIANLFKKDK
jgi:hypothetical protein